MTNTISQAMIACGLPATVALLWPISAYAGVELEVFNTTFQGNACVSVNHACTDPSEVTLSLGSTILLSYDVATAGDMPWIPEAPCIDTTKFSNGTHTLSVESTCGGVTTTDVQTIDIQNPSFGFGWVAPSSFEYNFGDTLTIDVELGQTGLDVGADFSAIDPSYVSGSETIVDNADGTYTISYLMSSTSAPTVGTYPVTFTADDSTVTLIQEARDLIRYAPSPTPRIRFAGDLSGEIVFDDPPDARLTSIAVTNWTFPTTDVTIGGEVTATLEIWTAVALTDDTVILDIGEVGGSGYIETVAPVINGSCGTSGCYYDVEVPLTLRPFAADTIPTGGQTMDISVGVAARFGLDLVRSPFGATGSLFYRPETEGQYAVIGRLTYNRVLDVVEENSNHSKYPQYSNLLETEQLSPIADTELVLYDGCSGSTPGRTYADGSFSIIFDTTCPEELAHVEIRTEAHKGYLNIEVTDYQGVVKQEPCTFEFYPDDTVHLYEWTYPVNEAALWSSIAALQQAIRVQRWAKTYLVGNQPIFGMPKLRVNYEYGVCSDGTSSYPSPIVEICGAVNNNDARDEFVMTHEYFHWFQDHFMADMKGNAGPWPESGAFGEGLCTVMPTMLDGSHHKREKNLNLSEAEDLDFSGKKVDDGGVLVDGLPVDLYVLTNDQGNGGWSWRILWDFYDTDSGTSGVAEPESEFTREPYGGAAGVTDYGDFDKVGDPEVFHDVVRRYLGGNLVSGNLANDSMSVYYYGARGVDAGLGMTEFLDGALCRSSWNSETDVGLLVNTVMDFQFYDPNDAPTTCP